MGIVLGRWDREKAFCPRPLPTDSCTLSRAWFPLGWVCGMCDLSSTQGSYVFAFEAYS